jgi:adenylate cyclase class 2
MSFYGITIEETSMATEIELKAHVKDSETLKKNLLEKAEFIGTFEKEDVYWFGARLLPASGLRIRKEKRCFADGTGESTVFVTYKTKELWDGVEINDEREFEVNPAEVFEELLKKMALEPGMSKRKQGLAFVKEGINAELMEVENLGWFVELEILAENSREETITEGKERLLAFLDSLGIEREAIEKRFYSELLSLAKK